MKPVLLDTVGLLALWDTSDQWHVPANEAFTRMQSAGRTLITTSMVLLECGNAAARRSYRSAPKRLWAQLDSAGMLIHPTAQDMNQAWQAYESGAAGTAGIVDHISFGVMRRLGVTQAFTNDRHFLSAGFEILF